MDQSQVDALEMKSKDVHPMNNLTNENKLDIAIAMAEGMANLHGFSKGVIVHDDVHPDQWLSSTKYGRIVLNDLNNAKFLGWNFTTHNYCKLASYYEIAFHAPEQYNYSLWANTDEKSDIWSFGNVLFALITGLWTYYDQTGDDDDIIQDLVSTGSKPYLNPLYRNHSYIESRMLEIMDKCYVLKPEDRVSIFEILEYLQETKSNSVLIERGP